MQYVDCDRAEKHGDLCLGYGYEEIDEPCEVCKNCIKCESGYYQLGETEKDDQLAKAKEMLRMVIDSYNHKERFSFEKDLAKAEQFLKEYQNGKRKEDPC